MTPSLLIAFALIVVLAIVGLIQGVQIGRLTERVRKLERLAGMYEIKVTGGRVYNDGVTSGCDFKIQNGTTWIPHRNGPAPVDREPEPTPAPPKGWTANEADIWKSVGDLAVHVSRVSNRAAQIDRDMLDVCDILDEHKTRLATLEQKGPK